MDVHDEGAVIFSYVASVSSSWDNGGDRSGSWNDSAPYSNHFWAALSWGYQVEVSNDSVLDLNLPGLGQ